jgi:hypothetical protein
MLRASKEDTLEEAAEPVRSSTVGASSLTPDAQPAKVATTAKSKNIFFMINPCYEML